MNGSLVSIFLALGVPLALFILVVSSWWIIYEKMGERGWVCLIPFYGRYILFKQVWEGKIYFISLVLNTIAYLFFGNMMIHILRMSTISAELATATGVGIILFSSIFSFIALVVQLILNWRMTKCFGYGIGFFLGITFLPVIFLPILAYGRSYYDYY